MTASFLAALPSTLGFGTGLEAPFPPITISEKADSLLSVCLCLVTAGKCIRGPAAGAREPALGRWVVIQSQAVLKEAVFIGPWGPLSAFVLTHSLLQKKTPKSEEKLLIVFSKM